MENEKVIETAVQEPVADDSNAINNESSPEKVETISMDEHKKALQSASSKAKYDILKELGINSVKEFQELKTTYETAINEKSSLEETVKDLNNKRNSLEEDLLLTKLGVSDEYKNDLLTLAKSKVSENQNLETVSKELLDKYPQWRGAKETIKMGTEKADVENKPEVSSELLKKYSWLRD